MTPNAQTSDFCENSPLRITSGLNHLTGMFFNLSSLRTLRSETDNPKSEILTSSFLPKRQLRAAMSLKTVIKFFWKIYTNLWMTLRPAK